MENTILSKLTNKTTFINDTTLYKSTSFIQSIILSTTNTLLVTKSTVLFPDINTLKQKERALFVTAISNLPFILDVMEQYDYLLFYKTGMSAFDMVMVRKVNDRLGKCILFVESGLVYFDWELSVVRDTYFCMGLKFKIRGSMMVEE